MVMIGYEKRKYEQAPEGRFQAVCVDVIGPFEKDTNWGRKRKVRLVFQISERGSDGKRLRVSREYTASMHPKAPLRETLEAWRGRRFTEEEERAVDLERLVGQNCEIQVMHKAAPNGDVWANIQAILPMRPGDIKLTPEDYVRDKDRPKQQGTREEDEVPF